MEKPNSLARQGSTTPPPSPETAPTGEHPTPIAAETPLGRAARSRQTAGAPTRRGRTAGSPKQPPAASASDTADILPKVRVALSTIQIFGLTISSQANEPGVVFLNGTTRTEANYQRAETLAANTPGVTRVVNQLAIDPMAGSMPVRRTVLSPELAAEIELNDFHFAPGTEDRFTNRVGTTDTAEAADEAEPFFPATDPVVRRAPRRDEGIEVVGGFSPTALDSPIELEQLPNPLMASDDEIARCVRLALQEDAGTADLPIFVTVRRGVVHLRGAVPSLADAELAEEVASRVPQAVEVQEDLDVAGV